MHQRHALAHRCRDKDALRHFVDADQIVTFIAFTQTNLSVGVRFAFVYSDCGDAGNGRAHRHCRLCLMDTAGQSGKTDSAWSAFNDVR